MIISEAVALAKSDLDYHRNKIQEWTRDFMTLLSPETRARDLVFTEMEGLQPIYIALTDCSSDSRMLVIQVIPPNASKEELQMVCALTSVIASLLLQRGHVDVAVALLGETGGKLFWHEGFLGRCRSTVGCSRIPEAPTQFNFGCIPGHICRTAAHITLN